MIDPTPVSYSRFSSAKMLSFRRAAFATWLVCCLSCFSWHQVRAAAPLPTTDDGDGTTVTNSFLLEEQELIPADENLRLVPSDPGLFQVARRECARRPGIAITSAAAACLLMGAAACATVFPHRVHQGVRVPAGGRGARIGGPGPLTTPPPLSLRLQSSSNAPASTTDDRGSYNAWRTITATTASPTANDPPSNPAFYNTIPLPPPGTPPPAPLGGPAAVGAGMSSSTTTSALYSQEEIGRIIQRSRRDGMLQNEQEQEVLAEAKRQKAAAATRAGVGSFNAEEKNVSRPDIASVDDCFKMTSIPARAPELWRNMEKDFFDNYFGFFCNKPEYEMHMGESWYDGSRVEMNKHAASGRKDEEAKTIMDSMSEYGAERAMGGPLPVPLPHRRRMSHVEQSRDAGRYESAVATAAEEWEPVLEHIGAFCRRYGVGLNARTQSLRDLALRANAAVGVLRAQTLEFKKAQYQRDAFARAEGLTQTGTHLQMGDPLVSGSVTEETKQKWRQETREELGASRGSLTYLQEESEKWRKETREALIAVRGAQARVAEVYKECLQNTQTSLRHVFGGIVQEESLEIEESLPTSGDDNLPLLERSCPNPVWFAPQTHQWMRPSTESALLEFLQSEVDDNFPKPGGFQDAPMLSSAYLGQILPFEQELAYHPKRTGHGGGWDYYRAPTTAAPGARASAAEVASEDLAHELAGHSALSGAPVAPDVSMVASDAARAGLHRRLLLRSTPAEAAPVESTKSSDAEADWSVGKEKPYSLPALMDSRAGKQDRGGAKDTPPSRLVALVPMDWTVANPAREAAFSRSEQSESVPDQLASVYRPWATAAKELAARAADDPESAYLETVEPGVSQDLSGDPVLGRAVLQNPFLPGCHNAWIYEKPDLIPNPAEPSLAQEGYTVAGVTNLLLRTKGSS